MIFLIYDSDDTENEFNKPCITSYFNKRVEQYKIQDRKGKRDIPNEDYIHARWFMNNITNQCNYCGCGFRLYI